MNVHSQARTTPKIREEIRASKGHMTLVVELRRSLLLTVDDLLVVVREFIYDKIGVHRCSAYWNVTV